MPQQKRSLTLFLQRRGSSLKTQHGIKVSEMTIRAFAARRSLAAFTDAARPPLSLASRKLRRTFAQWMKCMWELNPNWHEWVVWSDESIVTVVRQRIAALAVAWLEDHYPGRWIQNTPYSPDFNPIELAWALVQLP
ncbi:MAG: hypothetical protein MHM6MM_004258 [Cercozoa sp. M6MM]